MAGREAVLTSLRGIDETISHILLADRSGASAVVEFLPEGVVVSRTDTPYQVMTNSHWAGPSDQPNCERYRTAVEGLGNKMNVQSDKVPTDQGCKENIAFGRRVGCQGERGVTSCWRQEINLAGLVSQWARRGSGFSSRGSR
jgi:hypothetical protein